MRTLRSLCDHHFLVDIIDSRTIVVDLGANLGEFLAKLNEMYGCRCYAVEASPTLVQKSQTQRQC